MVYLFLDMDGVLHPVSSSLALRWSGGHRVAELLKRNPSVQIVVTSNYRWHLDLDDLRALFPAAIRDRVVGATPVVLLGDGQNKLPGRHREVLAWLSANATEAVRWLAVDDDPGHYAAQCEELYLTDGQTGLTDEDLDVLTRRLQLLAPG